MVIAGEMPTRYAHCRKHKVDFKNIVIREAIEKLSKLLEAGAWYGRIDEYGETLKTAM